MPAPYYNHPSEYSHDDHRDREDLFLDSYGDLRPYEYPDPTEFALNPQPGSQLVNRDLNHSIRDAHTNIHQNEHSYPIESVQNVYHDLQHPNAYIHDHAEVSFQHDLPDFHELNHNVHNKVRRFDYLDPNSLCQNLQPWNPHFRSWSNLQNQPENSGNDGDLTQQVRLDTLNTKQRDSSPYAYREFEGGNQDLQDGFRELNQNTSSAAKLWASYDHSRIGRSNQNTSGYYQDLYHGSHAEEAESNDQFPSSFDLDDSDPFAIGGVRGDISNQQSTTQKTRHGMFDWSDKGVECYHMWIVEGKTLRQIMDFYREERNFFPSMRVYQAQFAKWGFPRKFGTPTDPNLMIEIKELWEANTSRENMINILGLRGYSVDADDLIQIERRHHWSSKAAAAAANGTIANPKLVVEVPFEERRPQPRIRRPLMKIISDRATAVNSPPASRPSRPQYPSETPIVICKENLQITRVNYVFMRNKFIEIISRDGILRKTLGDGRWSAAKSELIEACPFLRGMFQTTPTDESGVQLLRDRQNAVEVICADIIKSWRARYGATAAQQILGMTQTQVNATKHLFLEMLATAEFTSKLGHNREWEKVKDALIARSSLLREIFAAGESDPGYARRSMALDVLCRDVMKEQRADVVEVEEDKDTRARRGCR